MCSTAACFVFIWFHSHPTVSLFFLSLFQLHISSSESSRTATLKEKFSQREIVFHLEAHLKMTKTLKL